MGGVADIIILDMATGVEHDLPDAVGASGSGDIGTELPGKVPVKHKRQVRGYAIHALGRSDHGLRIIKARLDRFDSCKFGVGERLAVAQRGDRNHARRNQPPQQRMPLIAGGSQNQNALHLVLLCLWQAH